MTQKTEKCYSLFVYYKQSVICYFMGGFLFFGAPTCAIGFQILHENLKVIYIVMALWRWRVCVLQCILSAAKWYWHAGQILL